MDDVLVRDARKEDSAAIVALIKELAIFEKMPDDAKLTVQDIERDGFGPQPLFRCFVAEVGGSVVGMALYYFTYSTWKGKCLYLEDFMVTEQARNQQIGSKIFKKLAQTALDEGCNRIDFEVLSWNPATNFYKRKGGIDMTLSEDWHKFRVENDKLPQIANGFI